MARGYKGYRRDIIDEDPKILKLFWDGEVPGVTWNYNRKLPDSDSRESHSISNGEIRMSTSGYYAELGYYTPPVDFSKYSKLYFEITKSTGVNGGRIVGYSINSNLGTGWAKQLSVGKGQFSCDISSVTGSYYVKLWVSSGNRVGSTMNISRIWLEK